MLKQPRLKKYARMFLMSRGLKRYKKTTFSDAYQYWQAGKGVDNITSIESSATVIKAFEEAFAELQKIS
jgi:hypothetical protein